MYTNQQGMNAAVNFNKSDEHYHEPNRDTPILQELRRLDEATNRLIESVAALEDRLQFIVAQEAPMNNTKNIVSPPAVTSLSGMTMQLRSNAERVFDATAKIEIIRKRLEL